MATKATPSHSSVASSAQRTRTHSNPPSDSRTGRLKRQNRFEANMTAQQIAEHINEFDEQDMYSATVLNTMRNRGTVGRYATMGVENKKLEVEEQAQVQEQEKEDTFGSFGQAERDAEGKGKEIGTETLDSFRANYHHQNGPIEQDNSLHVLSTIAASNANHDENGRNRNDKAFTETNQVPASALISDVSSTRSTVSPEDSVTTETTTSTVTTDTTVDSLTTAKIKVVEDALNKVAPQVHFNSSIVFIGASDGLDIDETQKGRPSVEANPMFSFSMASMMVGDDDDDRYSEKGERRAHRNGEEGSGIKTVVLNIVKLFKHKG
eukprot:CAMPEP_0184705568 /NCGR_PEP_ID=MMETSP0313-20130426/34780_1 /TAXON_ID=2792 /ORGANISM="Porphyridium aerugineum, Strain SAG 1380-2" /LENGTH=321 /DNA_ID=CAMNT_0027166943 /DNA_START=445 /DNA_END=1410 /DNA_ORIENTATION=-